MDKTIENRFMRDLHKELELMKDTKLTTVKYPIEFAVEIIQRAIIAEKEVSRLKQKVEKMKCCYNCKNIDDCPREYRDYTCNKWEVEDDD